MKTLIVLDGNCGDEAEAYLDWLLKNLPDDIRLDWRYRESGASGGLFNDNGNEIDNPYWEAFCN